jgi:type I restriction enzyme, S subunit
MSVYNLSDLCTFINGGSWSDSEYVSEGIPVIKVSNLKNSDINTDDIDYISEKSFKKYKKNELKTDDVIVATVGSHPSLESSAAGRSSVVTKIHSGYLLNQNAVCIRSKNAKLLDQKFLGYIAKSKNFYYYIQNRGSGAANQMRIPIEEIKSFNINLPSLIIQKKIIKLISVYDDLIANNTRHIQLLEESIKINYEEWFLRFKVNGKKLDIDKSTGLPFGWKSNPLGLYINFHGGYSFKSENYETDQKYKIVTIKNVQDGYFNPKKVDTLSVEPNNISPHQRLNDGDYIMSLTGNIGRVCLVYGKDYLLNQRVVKIEPKKILDYSFIYALFRNKNTLTLLESISYGTAQQNLSTINIEKIKLPIPDSALREKFNNKIKPKIDLIINLYLQNILLKEALDILFPRLMTGIINTEKMDITV